MIGIVDYGMGNLRSVQKAIERVGSEARVVDQPEQLDSLDKLILPGVGAFADAMAHLRQRHLVEAVCGFVESGKPFLGICLGLQLLFETSAEDGEHEGLGLVPGRVIPFEVPKALKVPQMGWNALAWKSDDPILAGLDEGCHVYFVHSYFAQPSDESVIATTTDYGGPFCSAIRRDNIFATQFHPEKSQRVGLKMLENFAAL